MKLKIHETTATYMYVIRVTKLMTTVCGLDCCFACYHIHKYVALSVIGHRMYNRISGLCDKSSVTLDTKRYREHHSFVAYGVITRAAHS